MRKTQYTKAENVISLSHKTPLLAKKFKNMTISHRDALNYFFFHETVVLTQIHVHDTPSINATTKY